MDPVSIIGTTPVRFTTIVPISAGISLCIGRFRATALDVNLPILWSQDGLE